MNLRWLAVVLAAFGLIGAVGMSIAGWWRMSIAPDESQLAFGLLVALLCLCAALHRRVAAHNEYRTDDPSCGSLVDGNWKLQALRRPYPEYLMGQMSGAVFVGFFGALLIDLFALSRAKRR